MSLKRHFLLLIACIASMLRASDDTASAVQWQPWATVLTAEQPHVRPYHDLVVDVTFTGPAGHSFVVPAFWDGGREFRVRAAFPVAGKWTWHTRCSDAADAGLHGRSGDVHVSPYRGGNPLFAHGDLKASADRRYLMHADGTPFLWIGDTGWNAAWKSTPSEWRQYVDTRAGQGFSVLQVIATGFGSKKAPPPGPSPFLPDGSPDAAVWRTLEEKVGYANERGLIVMLTGVGRSYVGYTEQQTVPAFARYIAGRFAGHFVIFSPSMDQKFDPLNETAGERYRAVTTHLIVQHPATDFPSAQRYHDAAYTDFSGVQTGHHNGKLAGAYEAARTWPLQLWNRQPRKPVINIEAMYDAYGSDEGPNWREQDARKLGWISWLCGARGYTYGAGDVPPKVPRGGGGMWVFNSTPGAYDQWQKVLDWPSARQMTHLRTFLAALRWWELVPAPEIVQHSEVDPLRIPVASRSASGDAVVVYLPDDDRVRLRSDAVRGLTKARWYNPVVGMYADGAAVGVVDGAADGDGAVVFTRPTGWQDAVLLLTK